MGTIDSANSCKSGKKRATSDLQGDSDQESSPKQQKRPIMSSTRIKREREKLRRVELSDELDNLSELVFRIDPSLISGREECFQLQDTPSTKKRSRTNNVTNRTELVKSSIRLIENLHSELKAKDLKIAALTKQLLLQHQPASQNPITSTFLSAQRHHPLPLMHSTSVMSPPLVDRVSFLGPASQNKLLTESDSNQKQGSFMSSFPTSHTTVVPLLPGALTSVLPIRNNLTLRNDTRYFANSNLPISSILRQQQYATPMNKAAAAAVAPESPDFPLFSKSLQTNSKTSGKPKSNSLPQHEKMDANENSSGES